MKRLICILIALFTVTTTALALQPEIWVHQSSEYSADQTSIAAGPGYLYGIMIATDGTNDCDFVVYDNTANSGTKLLPEFTAPTGSEDRHRLIWFDDPISFDVGLSIDITLGAGTVGYMVFYRMK